MRTASQNTTVIAPTAPQRTARSARAASARDSSPLPKTLA